MEGMNLLHWTSITAKSGPSISALTSPPSNNRKRGLQVKGPCLKFALMSSGRSFSMHYYNLNVNKKNYPPCRNRFWPLAPRNRTTIIWSSPSWLCILRTTPGSSRQLINILDLVRTNNKPLYLPTSLLFSSLVSSENISLSLISPTISFCSFFGGIDSEV